MMSTPFNFLFMNFMWNIYGMHLKSHMQTLFHALCMQLRRQKEATHIRLNYDIFREKFSEKNWIFEFLSGKYPISKNKFSEMESGKWSYDHFKINKISAFFRKRPHGFQNFIQTLFGYFHYKKMKWICVGMSMMHILHHIRADIYIFNKIFKEHKLAQLRGLLRVKDIVA